MEKEKIWILIRLQIIYEMSRIFNGEVSLVKQLNQAYPDERLINLDKLKQKKQAIVETVDFYKNLQAPDCFFDEFSVEKDVVSKYMLDLVGDENAKKYLFSLISPFANFGLYKEGGNVIKLYSDGKKLISVSPDGVISTEKGQEGILLVDFMYKLFGHVRMPILQEFMQIDIASTLASFIKNARLS